MDLNDDLGVVKEILDEKTLGVIVIGGEQEIEINAEKEEIEELKELLSKEVIIVSFDRNTLKLDSVGE